MADLLAAPNSDITHQQQEPPLDAQWTERRTDASASGGLKLYFGTNRNRVSGSDYFGPEFEWGPNDPRYHTGSILLSEITKETLFTQNFNISASNENPKKMIRAFLNDSAAAQSGTSTISAKQSLVFIHGYAFKFTEVFEVARVVSLGYGSPNNLFFSWPSYGDHFRYADDEIHAYASGTAVGNFLKDLFDEVDAMAAPPKLSLVCHSMGNRVLSSAVQALRARRTIEYKQYFDHILLFAADEDYKALQEDKKLKPLLSMMGSDLNIYTNGDDLALAAGQAANGGVPELGRDGPYSFPITDDKGQLLRNVYWINCQKVADPFLSSNLGHQYFRLVEKVIRDANLVLKDTDPSQIAGRLKEDGFEGQKYSIER